MVGCYRQQKSIHLWLNSAGCPLWVTSGHFALHSPCPLYPRKRTFVSAVGMSAAQADISGVADIYLNVRFRNYLAPCSKNDATWPRLARLPRLPMRRV